MEEEDRPLLPPRDTAIQDSREGSPLIPGSKHGAPWRDLAAFWIFGLTNNFPYVVMLSAANDILKEIDPSLGTGVILLADILPDLLLKLTFPFVMQRFSYPLRAVIVVIVNAACFLTVSLSRAPWLSLMGVACASISSGLGEMTFLSLTTQYHQNTLSAWSSGTGGAGVLGSLSYLFLTLVLSPSHALLVMLFGPALMAAGFWLVLSPSPAVSWFAAAPDAAVEPRPNIPIRVKARLLLSLLRFMAPLFVVYFAEYLINQGVYESVYWTDEFIDKDTQYRVFQTLYQVGVFISRSSMPIFPVDRIIIPAILQCINLVLMALDCRFKVLPSIWLWFVLIVYEGLLGGTAYVNAFRLIGTHTAPEHREFAMGIGCLSSSIGIALAGAAAVGLHQGLKDVGGRTK